MSSEQKEKDKTTYLLKQYDTARKLIENDFAEINRYEQYIAGAIAAYYLLLLKIGTWQIELLRFMLSFPIIIVTYGFFRYQAHRRTIKIHEEFIKEQVDSYFLESTNSEYSLARFHDRKSKKWFKKMRLYLHVMMLSTTLFIFAYSILQGNKLLGFIGHGVK